MSLPLSISKLVEAVYARTMDPADVVQQCLDRISSRDAQLKAWVDVDAEGALDAAQRLSQRVERGGAVGPLAGVPVGVKDIFDVKGLPTRGGSPLRDKHVASCDSEAVARLRAADAIILGKTVTTEFACFDPPATINPWSSQHTPGGSSSGSAAALAANMCMAALGSQTGGSISRPAAYCGVTGLKPAHGRLPLDGVIPVSFHLDHPGPMARSVSDLAAVWHGLSGDELLPAPVDSPTLAVLDSPWWTPDSAQDAYEASLQALGELPRLKLPTDWEQLRQEHWTVMAVEAAAVHREAFAESPDQFGEKISGLITTGLETPSWRYANALAAQREFQHDVRRRLAPWDAVITPSATGPAPLRDSTGDPRMNAPWSFAGLPTIALPSAWHSEGNVELPVGLQLVSVRPEAELLATARWCEQRLGWSTRDW